MTSRALDHAKQRCQPARLNIQWNYAIELSRFEPAVTPARRGMPHRVRVGERMHAERLAAARVLVN